MASFTIIPGDSFDVLDQFPDNYFSAIVTDPPYGLGAEPNAVDVLTDWVQHGYHEIKTNGGFMGKHWDSFVPQPALWRKVFRVLKPGGYLLSFFGTRTYDWGTMAIRLAGFEVRDQIAWTYGEGMPKGLNVSTAIDKHLGEQRKQKTVVVTGDMFTDSGVAIAGKTWTVGGWSSLNMRMGEPREVFAADLDPASDAEKVYNGWNTSLKPAWEPIAVCRKPFAGSVAKNILEHGTGAINADGCRVSTNDDTTNVSGMSNEIYGAMTPKKPSGGRGIGRFPANIVHDGSQGVLNAFGGTDNNPSRFFYCAKATRTDRDAPGVKNTHETVKPTALMQWLIRLVTPPGGIILDPFFGSGSTGKAAMLEDFDIVGIELSAEMCEIARARTEHGQQLREISIKLSEKQPKLFPEM